MRLYSAKEVLVWDSLMWIPWHQYNMLQMVSCVYSSHFSDDSVVLKVITIYNKDTDTVEEVLLEELQVFQVPPLRGAIAVLVQRGE